MSWFDNKELGKIRTCEWAGIKFVFSPILFVLGEDAREGYYILLRHWLSVGT